MVRFNAYSTVLLDCDGVVLNSNRIKTDAFRATALPFGELAAERLVAYNRDNGGVSRYEKFRWFVDHVINDVAQPGLYHQLLRRFGASVRAGLIACEVAPGLSLLRQENPDQRWFIVSGGDQDELREVFDEKNIGCFFNGIYGSPDTKAEIINKLRSEQSIREPALFIGDSALDYQVASASGLDFVFLSKWTDIDDWEALAEKNGLFVRSDLLDVRGDSLV